MVSFGSKSGPPPPAPMAYFFSTFPHLSMTFLQREVRGLNALGLFPQLMANRPPADGQYDPRDADLRKQTFYLNPIHPGVYLRANFKQVIRSPRRYLKGVQQALKLSDGYPWQRLRNLARLAGAAVLADHLRAWGVRHVHVHFAFGAAGVALFLKILSGIPYSITIHGSDVLLPQPLTREKLLHAGFVVSNCRYHVAHLRQRFPSLVAQRFHVVSLGLDLDAPPWHQMEPSAPVPPLRILTVARFDPVKGHPILVRALARLKQKGIAFQCRLVGDGPTRSDIEKMVRQSELSDVVTFTGPLYEAHVAQEMDHCHVMVLSSFSEGTPMTVIEAMAKGRPVIAPAITGIPEMVVPKETGYLFAKGSHRELAACLARLACEPALITQMGIAGRKRAKMLFHRARNIQTLKMVFEKELNDF